MDTENKTSSQDTSQSSSIPQEGKTDNKLMAILSYIGPLVIVSYMTAKDDDFVKFHAKQGLVVFGLEVIIMFAGSMLYGFWMIMNLLNLLTLVLSIIGIVNVIQGQKKELPVVGKYANNINF